MLESDMNQQSPHYNVKMTATIDRQMQPKEAQRLKLLNMGVRFHEQGNRPEAETIYRAILREDFEYADAWHLLGVIAFQVDNHEMAIELISEAIEIAPEEPFYHNNLGNVYRKLDRHSQAVECYDKALALQPDYIEAHYNRATLLREQGMIEEAAESYRTVLRLRPDDVDALNDLGATLRQQGDLQGAIETYEKAIGIQPEAPNIRVNLGLVFEQQGDVDAAIACYEKAIELDPRNVRAHQCLVDLTTFTIDDEDRILQLEALLNDKQLAENDAEYVHWALGKVYDDCGLFDKAFRSYEIANNSKRQRKDISFDAAAHSESVSRLIATYSKAFLAEKTHLGSDSTLPIFVIGLPRSGKTLLESLITRHTEIHGADELGYFDRLSDDLPDRLNTTDTYPACISSIDHQTANTLAEAYIQELRKHSSEAVRIVNTIPSLLNLGLITLLFPKASIIHCRRDPLDVCLAIYFKSFARTHAYAYRLADIAAYFREYQRIMDHWYNALPGRILTVDYEDMVSNEAATHRRVIEWCGLPGDTRDDDVRRDNRLLRTQHVDRWKNYEEFIEPLKQGLGA